MIAYISTIHPYGRSASESSSSQSIDSWSFSYAGVGSYNDPYVGSMSETSDVYAKMFSLLSSSQGQKSYSRAGAGTFSDCSSRAEGEILTAQEMLACI